MNPNKEKGKRNPCNLQRALRAHFGIPEPATEHRAMDDVGVLAAIVPPLLAAAGTAPGLQAFMESCLSNGAASSHAGLVSEIVSGRSQSRQPVWHC